MCMHVEPRGKCCVFCCIKLYLILLRQDLPLNKEFAVSLWFLTRMAGQQKARLLYFPPSAEATAALTAVLSFLRVYRDSELRFPCLHNKCFLPEPSSQFLGFLFYTKIS